MGMGMGRGMGPHRRHGHDVQKPVKPLASFKRVLPWIVPYWPTIVFGFACMLVTTFLGQLPPLLTKRLIDEVLGQHQYQQATTIVLQFLGVFAGLTLFSILRMYFLHVAGQRLIHALRVKLYAQYQRLSLTYYDNHPTGDLMSRMVSDVEQIEHLMVHGLDVLVMGVLGMLLAFYHMHGISPHLALLILIPVPIIAVSIYFFSGIMRKMYRTVRDKIGDLNAKLQDNISGIRVIKAFNRERNEQDAITDTSRNVLDMHVRAIRRWTTFGPSMGFLGNAGKLIVYWFGIRFVAGDQLTVGGLIAFTMYIDFFYNPIRDLFQFFDSIQRSLAAADRIFEVLDAKPEIEDPHAPTPLQQVRGEVAFQQVSFRYATGEMVLKDVTITARPGERIALVGRSGAGKTSFVNLIPRFYEVLQGRVLIDGVDVREVHQEELRRHIAMVLQDTFLFNGTVKQNLRYGKLDATDAELEAAAKAANAHEFIARLPHGYDTEVGERGVKLSGGQKQRLAIARAVLADPRILILDEATSSVDSESEFLIHQALDRLMAGRTTFIIAHRLSTVRNADTILVLEDGEVVERGTHDELLGTDGLYAQMHRQQFWLDDLFAEDPPETIHAPACDGGRHALDGSATAT